MTKLIPKHKTGYLFDYDPNNPYHVHSNGEKVVIDPEQYEKHKDEPYFANIRKQVEEHQAAYPGPEYKEVINPEYRKVYANIRAASNQHFKEHSLNGQIYREYSDVPEEYFRNGLDGVVTDSEGNLYRPMNAVDAGRGVTPVFTNKERGHNGRYFDMSWVRVKTPEKTIKILKQPLPVDRTYNVDEELNNSVDTYIKNNTVLEEFKPLYYISSPNILFNQVFSDKDEYLESSFKHGNNSLKIYNNKFSDFSYFSHTPKHRFQKKNIQKKDDPTYNPDNEIRTDGGTFFTEDEARIRLKELQKLMTDKNTHDLLINYLNGEPWYNDIGSEMEAGDNKFLDLTNTTKFTLDNVYDINSYKLKDYYNHVLPYTPTRQEVLNNIQLNIE